ncbi:hypothetical protein EAH79_10160 [Sphingomonas koreensis]|nr:hypothetical protein EAH79_10160 [Sphingomonas koreensis]
MTLRSLSPLLLITPLLLGACHSRQDARNLDSLDNQLTSANAADPALAGALNDQIMVDPALTQQANGVAVRPPAKPYSAEVPPDATAAGGGDGGGRLRQAPEPKAGAACPGCATTKGAMTLGALAARQQSPRTGACAANVHYSAAWAARLGDLPVYPGANVSEAAGANGNGCALRVVSFTTPQPITRVIDWYYTQATKAGYSADQQSDGSQRVLGGTRARDDGAYVLFVRAHAGGGSDVDLVVNNGR